MKQIPFQYFFVGIFIVLLVVVFRSKPTLKEFFEAINSIDQNPMAILVLIIGCIMLLESKTFGVSETIAATIVGYGGGLLQGQLSKSHTDDKGTTLDTISATPIKPKDTSEITKE